MNRQRILLTFSSFVSKIPKRWDEHHDYFKPVSTWSAEKVRGF
jgi:hypothetical protein